MPNTATSPAPYQLALQQLCDSALPTGAFAHSLGFESYIERGLVHDEASFGVWLSAFVGQQLTYSDALAIRFLYEDLSVAELDALLTAQLLPRQLREASTKMGTRLLEIGAEIFPSPDLTDYRELVGSGRAAGHQPLAFAVVARSLGVPLPEALAAYLFAAVTSLTQNAVRAIPWGRTPASGCCGRPPATSRPPSHGPAAWTCPTSGPSAPASKFRRCGTNASVPACS